MKNNIKLSSIKLIIRYIFYGISWGCTCLVGICLFFYINGNRDLLALIVEDFGQQAVGAMAVGIGCGGTAIVYQWKRGSMFIKSIIHFCVGMGVFYPVAISLGWIPFHPEKVFHTILQFLFSCGIFMAIWFCFYLFNRNEAKKINKRLRELEKENTSQGR